MSEEKPKTESATSPESENNVFDISNLRLNQDFDAVVGVKKKLVTIPIRKPTRQEFIRVRPGDEWTLDTAVLELKQEKEFYLIAPDLWQEIYDDLQPRRLVLTMSRQKVLAVWPLALPDSSGRLHSWGLSALEGAEMAEEHWVKLQSNQSLGAYELFVGAEDLPEPVWPEEYTLQQILDIAFGKFQIKTIDHPVIKRLQTGL